MSRNFKVGDRVRLDISRGPCGCARCFEFDGLEGSVTAVLPNNYYSIDTLEPHGDANGQCMVPIYDGNEKVSWSSCVWQPRVLRVDDHA